jgi:hypothetical protein
MLFWAINLCAVAETGYTFYVEPANVVELQGCRRRNINSFHGISDGYPSNIYFLVFYIVSEEDNDATGRQTCQFMVDSLQKMTGEVASTS